MRKSWIVSSAALAASLALVPLLAAPTGPTTRPATQPSRDASAQLAGDQLTPEQMLNQMLLTPPPPTKPLPAPPTGVAIDKTSGKGAVAPNAPPVTVLREGSSIIDRVGRLSHNADATQAQFTFDSDGKALKDPPLILLPNLKLMAMEDVVKGTNRDYKFRVTGLVTEFRGRNYLLLEKVQVVTDSVSQF